MALLNKKDVGKINIAIPCEGTVRNVMEQFGLIHKVRRKPNGITKSEAASYIQTEEVSIRVQNIVWQYKNTELFKV
ncbi:MAG: hypothetical protein LUF89_00635 [Ruminococcus sp.]|nr:hypothetical protein [Ruminococcus sp.]